MDRKYQMLHVGRELYDEEIDHILTGVYPGLFEVFQKAMSDDGHNTSLD